MKKLMKNLKRGFTLFFAFGMTMNPILPGVIGQLTAHASTEMIAEELDSLGASDSIGYKWKSSGDWDTWGGTSYRYDLKGLRAGETNYNNGTMRISFELHGFPTYLVMLDSPDRQLPPRGNEIGNLAQYNPNERKSNFFYMAKLGQRDADGNRITSFLPTAPGLNGAVESLTFESRSGKVKLESKIVTSPSPDGKYMFVDYYLADVGGNMPKEGRTFFLGSPFDLQVGGSISKDIYKTSRGFYAVNNGNKSTVDIILNDPSIGVEEAPDTTKWVGYLDDRVQQMFTNSVKDSTPTGDYSVAYSWKFKLRPYEIIHRRVAFANKESSYYVSSSKGVNRTPSIYSLAGTFKEPFKTVEYAISQSKGKNVYIYIQDLTDISAAIDLIPAGFPANTFITISSADMDNNGISMSGKEGHIRTLKRAPGYTGPLFRLSRPGTAQFTDIILDGDNIPTSSPLIQAGSGTLRLISGTSVTNGMGGAISVGGSGSLFMNGGSEGIHITGNVSDHGAVVADGSSKLSVINNVVITGNKNAAGKEANVYLPEGKKIQVNGNLDASVIGVTTAVIPKASSEGKIAAADQEVLVAEPGGGYKFTGLTPFIANFRADQGDDGLYTESGSVEFHNEKSAVLKKTGYNIIYSKVDEGGAVISENPIEPMIVSPGDSVSVPVQYSGAAPDGYRLKGVEADHENFRVCTGDEADGSHEKFDVTGIMPGENVRVNYIYEKLPSTIVFHTNGASPQPEPLVGNEGDRMNSLIPSVGRYGYKLKEEGKTWSRINDRNHPDYIDPAVDWLRYPESQMDLYAILVPDSNVTFQLTEEHVTENGYLFKHAPAGSEPVEAPIHLEAAEIPGYQWSPADSGTAPEKYNYRALVSATPLNASGNPVVSVNTPIPIGAFWAGKSGIPDGFAGSMPGAAATIRFVYKVDHTVTFPLSVRYQTENGNDVFPESIRFYSAETPVRVEPEQRYGYECQSVSIDLGDDLHSTGGMVTTVDSYKGNSLTLESRMPNQPVQITYTYRVTDEGYPLTAKYIDNGSGDTSFQNIISPVVESHPADSEVHMDYRPQYGYELHHMSMTPSPDLTRLSFDGGGNIAGIMYDDEVTAVYGHTRISGKWAEITYSSEQNARGNLEGSGASVSSDLQPSGDGKYKAQVLISDSSQTGNENAWSLEMIEKKGLMPARTADNYYLFDGWFIDANGNNILDGDEEILKPDQIFTGPVSLVAHFSEDPDQWVDIRFAAGDHGTINPGQLTALHTAFDRTWGAVSAEPGLPLCTPEVHYLQETFGDGRPKWYDSQNRLMTEHTVLKKDETYSTRFYKDPAVFGTDPAAPRVQAGLGTRGEGRITVYNAAFGYRYVLADSNGRVLMTEDGQKLSSRAYFNDLLPGTRFKVYEAPVTSDASVGQDVNEIQQLSPPSDVLTPVVDSNYRVTYDENGEGKTKLTILPACREAQYALLDPEGRLVHTPETGLDGYQSPAGSPASVTFTGLAYNRKYTVVARPFASGIEAREEDGSVITTDPGGELELANYIIKTGGGAIKKIMREEGAGLGIVQDSQDETYFSEAHKGDTVYLTAEAADASGMAFNHWEFTIGAVPGLNRAVRTRELSFPMPSANLVLTAVYDRAASEPRMASVKDEVREGNREELALSPEEAPVLEGLLTTEEDRVLLNANHTDVTYRVVYQRTGVKATESDAVKAAGSQFVRHGEAYKAAWGLNVSVERYVGGRRVNNATASNASPSNASFKTWVQMGRNDVDMMDYELYDVTPDPDGGVAPVRLSLMNDPEETGGLFYFTAEEGHRYVMAYSRAYRLGFRNDTGSVGGLQYDYSFKVRRNEAPNDGYYAGNDSYGGVNQDQPLRFIGPNGASYRYKGWSRRKTAFTPFDPGAGITRKSIFYAYYDSDEKEVTDTRKALKARVDQFLGLRDDYFFKNAESDELKGYIETAQETLDRNGATREELEAALTRLSSDSAVLMGKLTYRYGDYKVKKANGNKGGRSGGGGGGGGTKRTPYGDTAPKSYRSGYNGNWVKTKGTDGTTAHLSYVLNGGMSLRNMWAKLENPEKPNEAMPEGAGEHQVGEAAERGAVSWYRFNDKGLVQTGWFTDNGSWYYCSTEGDGNFGKMATGFRRDASDGNWYYLDPASGAMATGWRQLDRKWYYFSAAEAGTYAYDAAGEQWVYGGGGGRPQGSMYRNEITPDGYRVGPDGAWLQQEEER